MTIANEITKLNTNLSASYTACNNKGATMPANQNFDNLATCIGSIQTGGGSTLITKTITANGTYNASSDNADGYSSVTVNVPNPSTGTLSITQNGTYDVTNYASANVSVSGGASQSFSFYSTEELEIYNYNFEDMINNYLTALSQCTPVMIYGPEDTLFAWKDANGNDFEFEEDGYVVTISPNGGGTWYSDGRFGTYYNIEITPSLPNPVVASVDIVVQYLTT